MKKILNILIFLFYLSVFSAYPKSTFTFKRYSVDNGLSENTVAAILQDKRGFMWFGTKEGLNKFDGHEFKIYKNDPANPYSLGNNNICAIVQDKRENLWIGADIGLYTFDYHTERFYPFTRKTAGGTEIQTSVNKICRENDSIYWFSTWGQGVFSYNINSRELVNYTEGADSGNLASNTTWTVYKDFSGNIWVGTRNGLCRYHKETNRFYCYKEHENGGCLKNNEVITINEDSDGDLWIGTWGAGLARFNRADQTFTTYMDGVHFRLINHIREVFEYEKNKLLIGSDDGLYLFDKKTKAVERIDNQLNPNSLSDQSVYSIYRDKENGIWIGTYFGGINYLASYSNVIKHYYPGAGPNSLSGKAVSRFCEDRDGNIWIATEDGGLNYFNPRTVEFTTFLPEPDKNSLSYYNIHALAPDGDYLWIGTFSGGIDVLDLRTKQFRNYCHNENDSTSLSDNCVFSIYKDSRNDIYIGTPYGLQKYNRRKDHFERIREIPEFIYDMAEDNRGYLWLASYTNGVYRYEYHTGRWKNYLHDKNNKVSVNSNKLISVHTDDKQRLWFTSEGNGICHYNYETDDFTTIDPGNGLATSMAYGLLDDKYGNIWVSTNYGIMHIDLSTMQSRIFTEGEGMQSNQFNYKSFFKAYDGSFYFGGVNGFNVFRPEDMPFNEFIPPIQITHVELLNDENPKEMTGTDNVLLKHSEASLRISFVSLSFVAPGKNKYAYMLEGMNDRWINLDDQKNVTFINLPPGKYTLHIRGSNNDGVWNHTGTSFGIVVLPPFWQTSTAYGIYLAVLLILLYVSSRYYRKLEIRKQQKKLEEYQQKKEKEIYDVKIGFFTDIAHEIRTPLSLIKAPLESIILSDDGSYETKSNLSVIEKNTDRLLELVNQLLDFRKMESYAFPLHHTSVNVKEVIDSILFRFRKSAAKRKLLLLTELTDYDVITETDKEAITKIISNLLTNALKHAKSKIFVRLDADENGIKIEVEDDGPGVPEETGQDIFEPFYQVKDRESADSKGGTGLGLALVKKLVNHLGGNITVSNTGNGALFTFGLPLREYTKKTLATRDEFIPEDYRDETDTPTSASLSRKKQVLVVEDNKELRSFLKQQLSVSYEVYTAVNGIAAMQILKKYTIDVIVSDIAMPVMDGFEFLSELRHDELFSHVPVILLSAKTNIDAKIKGLRSGADIYIEKPFSIHHLKAQIASILENRKKLIDKFTKYPLTSLEYENVNKKDADFIVKVNKAIEKDLSNPEFSIENLASQLAMSRSNLQRKIKGISGLSPVDYIRVIKLKKAAAFLISGKYQVNEVCYMAGFNNASYFSKCFQKQFGILPKDFIKGYDKKGVAEKKGVLPDKM